MADAQETRERLCAMFDAATAFGLDDEEIWAAIRSVTDRTPPNKPADECFEEVADALARRVEDKTRGGE